MSTAGKHDCVFVLELHLSGDAVTQEPATPNCTLNCS